MEVTLDLYDENVDEIVVARLLEDLANMAEKTFPMFSDDPAEETQQTEILEAALAIVLEYYGVTDESDESDESEA